MRILNRMAPTNMHAKKSPVSESRVKKNDGEFTPKGTDDRPIVRREKPNDLSSSEIRAKLEQRNEAKAQAATKKKEAPKDDFVTAMPEDLVVERKSAIKKPEKNKEVKEAPENTDKSVVLKSDVDKNDPNDPNVQEKLKTLLKTGGFAFSQKEKEALAQILNK
ncbi:hypothetical protein [Bacteriovorax sp. Seq25_V]|uniref:hypothetical protein n=1 Tax=Bacteriovorax sp. Seq25_V TaxID=1201288 RepID=UPI00038A0DDC|nr:hypothetical protein [Bacteriovorax sp. Seq25_V]EQC47424.1 hypothetical protein M900_0814 [Bacteriovorax sp. Seq25_V]